MIGGKRRLDFTPDEGFFAKGCYGIEGRREVPAVGPNDTNDFLSRLFAEARGNIAAEVEMFAPQQEKYETVMTEVSEIIRAINDKADADAAAAKILGLDHALTSKKEASALLKNKTSSLGLIWSKKYGEYVPKMEKEQPNPEEKNEKGGE
jgi:hypothetical protein